MYWFYFRDLLDLAQSIQTLPDLAEISKGASSNSYFLAASDSPMLAVEWAKKVEVSIIIICKEVFPFFPHGLMGSIHVR